MQKECCPYCRQAIMKHTHTFSAPLGRILHKVACKYAVGEPFHLQKDLSLTKNEYNNFQKLSYFGLTEKYYKDGRRQGGVWKLRKEAQYLINGGEIPRFVKTFNNEVIETSIERIALAGAIGTYEKPPQYAAKAEPAVAAQARLF